MVANVQTTKKIATNGQREALQFALVALSYFAVAKLGLQLAYVHPNATPIWPATGVAIAAVLLCGYRISPAVFIAAFAVNQLTAGSIFTSLGIAAGNNARSVGRQLSRPALGWG